jgi:hypothetical protein
MIQLSESRTEAFPFRKVFFETMRRILSRLSPVAAVQRKGRSGRTFPFIARLTRAYLNFEVKDLRRPEAARLWRVLEFKVQIRFSAAMR